MWPSGSAAAAWRAGAVVACVSTGMVAARAGPAIDSVMLFGLACLLGAAGLVLRGRASAAGLALGAAVFGAGWYTLRVREVAVDSLSRAVGGSAALVSVEAAVLSDPETVASEDAGGPWAGAGPRSLLTVSVDALMGSEGRQTVSGRVRVAVAEPLLGAVRAGDQVRLTGTLRPVAGPLNPGEPDRRLTAAQDGFVGTLALPRAELVVVLPPSTGAWEAARSGLLRLRSGLTDRARRLLLGGFSAPTESRSMLAAMILGEEETGLEEVRSAFTRLGLAQVMAISGFNLAVMAWVALVLVRATGDRGRLEPVVVGVLVLLYLLLLPAEAPILRSGIMVLALLGAEAMGRRHNRLAVLAWTALALILWKPLDLWTMGFQLSFVLVGAMLGLGPRLRESMFGPRVVGGVPAAEPWWHGARDQARAALSTAVLCWALAMPIVIYHTGLVSPLALIATMAVVPLVTVLMWVAYAMLVVGMLVPAAAGPTGSVLALLADWTVGLVRWMDGLPGSSFTLPRVSLLWTAAAMGVVVYWCLRGYLRNRSAWGLATLCALWLGVEVWWGPRLPAGVPLRIDTLAVGDGTCHLIRSGDAALLWDCGSMRPGLGRWLIPRAVRALGAWHVRTVVLTHPNYDHFSALLDVAGPLGVRTVLVPARFLADAADEPEGAAGLTIRRLAARGIEVRAAAALDSVRLGSSVLRVLSPPAGADWPMDNDHSLVALATPGGWRAPGLLLTGDIQDPPIERLLAGEPLRATVMELPHHGSAREAAMRLAAAVDPLVVLQSTGSGRAGDARWDPLRVRRVWYTTATDGASWVEFGAGGTLRSGAFLRPGFESRLVVP